MAVAVSLSFAGLELVRCAVRGPGLSWRAWLCEGGLGVGLVLVRGLAGLVSVYCRQQAAVFLFALGCRRWCGWTRWLAVCGGGGGLGWGWLQRLLAAGGGSPEVACCSLEGWWLRPWVWVPPSPGVGVGGGVVSHHSWLGAL